MSLHGKAQDSETALTADLSQHLKEVMKGCVYFKHNDLAAGILDFSVTWRGTTSWHEVKFADPDFKSYGLQELNACRLNLHGISRYIIYDNVTKKVSIISPNDLKNWKESDIIFNLWDHRAVANLIKHLHLERM